MTNDFAPEELENSDRIFKSATPKYTVDWVIKWIASICILISIALRASEADYKLWDLTFGIIGIFGWTIVSFMWRDRALIMLNTVSLILLLVGILNNLGAQ